MTPASGISGTTVAETTENLRSSAPTTKSVTPCILVSGDAKPSLGRDRPVILGSAEDRQKAWVVASPLRGSPNNCRGRSGTVADLAGHVQLEWYLTLPLPKPPTLVWNDARRR